MLPAILPSILRLVLLIGCVCLSAGLSRAQGSYTTTQTLAINNGTPCNAPSVRTIEVLDDFTVADVDLGLLITHSWRGDVRVDLVSPQGTRVRVLTTDTTAASQDNYNILLDDEATDLVRTGSHTTSDGTVAPPFENKVRPNNALSAFDGQGSLGTWQLEICDAFPTADNGTFQLADLRLTPLADAPAPVLTCGTGAPQSLVWTAPGGAYGWPAGTTADRSYTVGATDIGVGLAGAIDRFTPRNGTAMPTTTTDVSGGTGQFALASNVDFATSSESVTYTFSLGDAGVGVGGLQFSFFDVDQQDGDWQDRFDVAASLSGTQVPVVLTASAGNYRLGNSLIGLGPVDTAQAGGEGTVTVLQPLDQLTVTYRTGPRSPSDPDSQVMGYSLFDFCPLTTELSASKSVSVVGGGFMVPGADVLYTITVSNAASGGAPASDIEVSDTLPDALRFQSAQAANFQGGSFGALPSANSDCAGGACVVTFSGAGLAPGGQGTVEITARIK